MATLQEIDVTDPNVIEITLDALSNGAVMLQMPSVFTLIAPPNEQGAAWLDAAKARLPNKNYGSVLGELASFHRMARPGSLPNELASLEAMQVFQGAFIRISVSDEETHTPMVRSGTHQGLLLEGPHRALVRGIEKGLHAVAQPTMFGGHPFSAPLCTSANISGHPEGSIVDEAKARAFAQARGIRLWVRCPRDARALGSYPIFWLKPDRISIEREGPGLQALKAALPAHLFSA